MRGDRIGIGLYVERVRRASRSYHCPRGMNSDDLFAAGLEAVWQLLKARPQTPESHVVWKAMIDAIRSWRGRRHPRRLRSIDAEEAPEPLDGGPFPDEEAEMAEEEASLRAAMDELPPRQRLVVDRLLAGDQTTAIAKDLGVARPRVNQIADSAVKRIRQSVGKTG